MADTLESFTLEHQRLPANYKPNRVPCLEDTGFPVREHTIDYGQ